MRSERELLVECLTRLNGVQIPYMLTGSMASNYWGVPRSTHDLDFVLLLESRTIDSIVAAFEDAFFIQRESVENALKPPYQFNALDEESALKVDFWTLRDDPFEWTAFNRRAQVTLFGTPAWIATSEDVILHKLHWHRITPSDRQLADAAGIYAVQGEILDAAYLEKWASSLGVERELQDLRTGKIMPKTT